MKSKYQKKLKIFESKNDQQDRQQQKYTFFEKSDQFSKNLEQTQSKIKIQQVNEWKQKAHKSFLQVIQMQHLHQQEIQLLRQEYQEKQKNAKLREDELQKKIYSLQSQLKTINQFNMDISNSSFTIDNIDMINCKELNEQSKFDQSTLTVLQIKQLILNKSQNKETTLKVLKNQLLKEIDQLHLNEEKNIKIIGYIDKIYRITKQTQQDNLTLNEKSQQIQKKYQSLQIQYKSLKIQYESLQKQTIFLSNHIKRLSEQKFLLDKKYVQTLKNKKQIQFNLQKLKQTINEKKINFQNYNLYLLKNQDTKSCVNLNSSRFLSACDKQDWILDQLNSPKQNVKTRKGSLVLKSPQIARVLSKNNEIKQFINPIKNFRKNKEGHQFRKKPVEINIFNLQV